MMKREDVKRLGTTPAISAVSWMPIYWRLSYLSLKHFLTTFTSIPRSSSSLQVSFSPNFYSIRFGQHLQLGLFGIVVVPQSTHAVFRPPIYSISLPLVCRIRTWHRAVWSHCIGGARLVEAERTQSASRNFTSSYCDM